MNEEEKKTVKINICLTESQKEKADRLAKKDRRKTGQFLAVVIAEFLEKVEG